MGQHPSRIIPALGNSELEWHPSLARCRQMARPRLELLARHAAVLFVEVVTGSNGRNKSVNENRRSEILLRAHMSSSGGVHTAIQRGWSLKCTAIPELVKNHMPWVSRPL